MRSFNVYPSIDNASLLSKISEDPKDNTVGEKHYRA